MICQPNITARVPSPTTSQTASFCGASFVFIPEVLTRIKNNCKQVLTQNAYHATHLAMVLTTKPCYRCNGSGKLLDELKVGAMMRSLRSKKGYSLYDIARRMKYTPPYISDLELGKRQWRQELVDRYLEACK